MLINPVPACHVTPNRQLLPLLHHKWKLLNIYKRVLSQGNLAIKSSSPLCQVIILLQPIGITLMKNVKKSYQLITLIRWSPGTFRGSPLKHVCLSQSEGCVTLIEAETDEGLPQCYAQRHSLRSLRHQEELKFVEKFAPHFSLFEKNTIKEPTKYLSGKIFPCISIYISGRNFSPYIFCFDKKKVCPIPLKHVTLYWCSNVICRQYLPHVFHFF